jgi:ankyrin repeat protein
LKFKLDILKEPTNEKYIETEVDYPYLVEFTNTRIHFAEPRLRIKNVYNRLYNNAIILPKDDIKVSVKKRPSSAMNRKKSTAKSQNLKKKIVFNLKNSLISNEGKEFIIRITDRLYKKCYDKYSGGPTTIKNLQNPKEYLETYSRDSYYINYYSIIEPKTGNTFLHLATIDDFPEIVKYFIEKGADLNMKNSDGNTPLHLAIKAKRNKIIKLLIDNKAALDIPNNNGEIPFEYLTPDMRKEFGVDKIIIFNPIKKNNR